MNFFSILAVKSLCHKMASDIFMHKVLGDALTYTTRLLDVDNIKYRNILSCMKSQAEAIQDLVVIPEQVKVFEFKNMADSEGYLIDQFLKIEEAYTAKTHLLKFFSSDESLIYLLNQIKSETDSTQLDLVFSCFAKTHVRICSSELVATWMECLKVFEKRWRPTIRWTFIFRALLWKGLGLLRPQHGMLLAHYQKETPAELDPAGSGGALRVA